MTSPIERAVMPYIVNLIIGSILDYLANHADEIIRAIKETFSIADTDPEVRQAVQEIGYSPTQENLEKLSSLLEKKGEDPSKLAAILVNKTQV
jgi:hypothetical protein